MTKYYLLLILIIILPGCNNVKPWQKGVLSDYIMRSDRDQLASTYDEHVYFTREASSGGKGVGGGGCGCN